MVVIIPIGWKYKLVQLLKTKFGVICKIEDLTYYNSLSIYTYVWFYVVPTFLNSNYPTVFKL